MDSRLITSDVEKETNSFKNNLLVHSEALFHILTVNSSAFDCKEFIEHLINYLNEFERIQYSAFSSLIYNSDFEIRGVISTNLDKLLDYLFVTDFRKAFPDDKKREMIKKIIIKLWDHYHLAYSQLQDLNRDDFYEKFIPERDEIKLEIKEESKIINKELISMVAIFTAMSFLILGSLSPLSSILTQTIENLPVLNICIVCLFWGLCVYNLIYLFMYLVGKIIDKSITSRGSCKFYKRHMIFLIGNALIILSLIIVSWLYFIQTDINGWYTSLYSTFGKYAKFLPIFVLSGIIVLYLVILSIVKFVKMVIHKITKRHYTKKYGCEVRIEKENVYDLDWNILEVR